MTYTDEMVQRAVSEKAQLNEVFDLLFKDWEDLRSEANRAVLKSYHARVRVPISTQSLKESIQFLLSPENNTGFKLIEPKSAAEIEEYEAAEAERAQEAEVTERNRLLTEIEKRLVAKGMNSADIDERLRQFRFRNNHELSSVLFSLDETVRLRNMSRDELKREAKASVTNRDLYAAGTFPPLPSSFTNESLRALAKSDYPAFKRLQVQFGLDQLDARMGNYSKARIQPGTTTPAIVAAPKENPQQRREQVFTLPKEIDGVPLTAEWIRKNPKRIRELARLAGRGNAQAGFAAVTARLNGKG